MTSVEVYNLDDHDFKEPLIAFAKGDHVIGRGDLKCNDKRVSRRHAIISVRDDAAELKAIHINPCFFKSSNGKSIKTLTQDTNIELHDGDMFALVADKFWFRVKLMNGKGVDDNRRLSKRNQNDEQETSSNKRAKIDVTSNTQDRPVDTTKFLENIQQIVSEDYRNTLDDSNNDSNESVDLLTLMQTRENELDSNSSLNATQNVETQNNGQDHSEAEKLSNSEAEATSSPENIYQTTEDDATKETNIAENNYSKSEPVSVKTEPKEDEDDALKTEVPEGFSATVKKEPKIEPTEYDSRGASSSSAAAASTSGTSNKIARRDRCWYGASCYRKNPIHRQDFSHPGDADYDSDPDDDRPSCPFGNGCYRTNMDHRRQYKHSAKPAPKPSSSVSRKARNGNTMQLSSSQDRDEDTDSEDDIQPTDRKTQRAKRKAANQKKKFNETPEDDYDLEDPFIDDASSDAFEPSDDGDDSDWDDDVESAEETEDVKRLVKEAKRFTKKKDRNIKKGDQKFKEISSDEEDAVKDLKKDHIGSDDDQRNTDPDT